MGRKFSGVSRYENLKRKSFEMEGISGTWRVSFVKRFLELQPCFIDISSVNYDQINYKTNILNILF